MEPCPYTLSNKFKTSNCKLSYKSKKNVDLKIILWYKEFRIYLDKRKQFFIRGILK